jgi:tetratricopeptide (TPR) repeat protein
MFAFAVAVGVLLTTQAEEARDRARDAFSQGQELYRAGDYAAALAAFQSAEAARASPAAEYNIGRCHERLGQLDEAVNAYERYLTEAPDAPDHDALAEHVAELRRQIPADGHLSVSVEPSGATVKVDQSPPEPAPVDKLLPPGRHVVLAELSGHTPAHRDVDLVAGGSLQLELTLRPLEPPSNRAPEAAVREDVPPPAPRSVPGERKWTYVALTAAMVAVGVGLAFGASAQSAQNQLQSRIHTQAAAQQLYDTANARAAAANSFYAGAAVAGAAAVTLFFIEPALGHSP